MISPLAFKIAAQLIDQQLSAPAQQEQASSPQHEEPADLPRNYVPGYSALRFFSGNDSVTAKEPAPKVVTVSGGREGGAL